MIDKCKVVPHLNDADHPNVGLQGCGVITIPASAIRKLTDIKIAVRKKR